MSKQQAKEARVVTVPAWVYSYEAGNDYQVGVRAPLANKIGADELCSAFPSGGGRKAAAGINHLPDDKLTLFIEKFEDFYS